MKTINEMNEKIREFAELSGLDAAKLEKNLGYSGFEILECETPEEMEENGVDENYPYVVKNPFGYPEKSMRAISDDFDLIIELKNDIAKEFSIPSDNLHLVGYDDGMVEIEAGDGDIYGYDEGAVNEFIEEWMNHTYEIL